MGAFSSAQGCGALRGAGPAGRAARAARDPADPPFRCLQRRARDGRHDAPADRPRRPGQDSTRARAFGVGRRAREPMSQEWGRADAAGTWPRPKPIWTLALLFAAIVSGATVGAYRYTTAWTPLQRLFLSPYLRSEFASALAFKTGRYRLLQVIDRKGSRVPLDEEVRPLTAATAETAFGLSDLGVQAGDLQLAWQERAFDHARLHALLREWIYRDQTLTDLAMPALWGSLAVFVVGLVVAIPKDIARARARRHGRRLKGPELVTAATLNRRTRADGIGFVQTSNVVARLSGRRSWVRVPRALESSHLLIMGDSGTGKSALIRQILSQLEDRGNTAIVYDPALEYTPQFYTPERGDVILNPIDERSPYWSPGD